MAPSMTVLLVVVAVLSLPLAIANIVVGATADPGACVHPPAPYALPSLPWDMRVGLQVAGWLSVSTLAFWALMWGVFVATGSRCALHLLRAGLAALFVLGKVVWIANTVVLFSVTYGWCPYDGVVKLALYNTFVVVILTLLKPDAVDRVLREEQDGTSPLPQ